MAEKNFRAKFGPNLDLSPNNFCLQNHFVDCHSSVIDFELNQINDFIHPKLWLFFWLILRKKLQQQQRATGYKTANYINWLTQSSLELDCTCCWGLAGLVQLQQKIWRICHCWMPSCWCSWVQTRRIYFFLDTFFDRQVTSLNYIRLSGCHSESVLLFAIWVTLHYGIVLI